MQIADLLLHQVILLGPVEMSLLFLSSRLSLLVSVLHICLGSFGEHEENFSSSFLFGFTSLAAAIDIGGDQREWKSTLDGLDRLLLGEC